MSVPKLHPTVRYAEPEYWDSRYEREPSLFEWFFGYTALRRVIRAYISKKKPILQIGCGTSNIQEGMAQSGYSVVNTDISTVVIKQMKERHAKCSNLSYVVSDCRKMPEFRDCQFGHVIDKGTMDALLCCKNGTDNVFAMLQEAYRVLSPGGSFLLVTLGDPTRRLPLLVHPQLRWKISLLLLPKISGAAQAYVDGKPINDTLRPIDAEGPYEVLDGHTIVGLPANVNYADYFFAYVCKKQPLQLPLAQGERAQLPNGWVAGSKELFQKLQKELGLPEDLLEKGRRKRVIQVPVGSSRTGLPTAPSANSSNSSSNPGAATALAVPAVPHLAPVNQEDKMQPQELTASTPSVAPLQGQQKASAAQDDLEALLSNVHQQGQEQGLLQNGAAEATEAMPLPVRPQSAPNLAELETTNLPLHILGRVSSVASNDADGTVDPAPTEAASRPTSTAAVGAAQTATETQGMAVQQEENEQQQQQQEEEPASLSPKDVIQCSCTAADNAPAGAQFDSAQLYGSFMPAGHQERPPSWNLGCRSPDAAPAACAAAAPRAPRAERAAAAKVRRFSTECSSHSLTALQPQLAMLRQQQAQHSERAADGLVMHDVAANDACGSSAAALAGAVWGHTRPPRNRRLSNVSVMSSLSVLSSTSISNTEEEESEAADDYASLCTSGDSQLQGAQQQPDVGSTSGSGSSGARGGRQTVLSGYLAAEEAGQQHQQTAAKADAAEMPDACCSHICSAVQSGAGDSADSLNRRLLALGVSEGST